MKKEIIYTRPKIIIPSMIWGFFLLFSLTSNAYVIFQENPKQDSQTFIEYKGIVIDGKTKDPLAFANLNINGTNISTVTNADGEFLLKIPNKYSDKSVTITFLGYNTKEVSLKNLNVEDLEIMMEATAIELTEVKLKGPKDAMTLVRATFDKKAENYYDNEAIMTAFYRETIKKRRQNASLSEAVVEIYKQPYQSFRKDAVKLIKARKSTDYRRLDTLALKLQGGPFSTLYGDIVKYPEYIFSENNFSEYEFSFDKSAEINSKTVYVVNFKQRPDITYPLYYGKLYIDPQTFALTRAIYNLNVENKELAAEMFVRKKPRQVVVYPTEAAYRVDYRIKDGKWYYGYSNVLLTFKVDWEGKLFNSVYTLSSEMAITDWEENITGIARPKESIRPTFILSEEASGFSDPEFWGEYNIIEPEKSIESAIEKINKKLKRIQDI